MYLPFVWSLATHVPLPRLFGGATFHRAALVSAHHGDYALAECLFRVAAARYRHELHIEPLARLRVHQEIARVRGLGTPERDPSRCIEVERALARLTTIESLEPPFELVDADSLLASWLEHAAPDPSLGDARLARTA